MSVRSSIALILMGKSELVALLNLSSWCLVMVERLFLAVPHGCLRFVIMVFPDHTHLLFYWKHVGNSIDIGDLKSDYQPNKQKRCWCCIKALRKDRSGVAHLKKTARCMQIQRTK